MPSSRRKIGPCPHGHDDWLYTKRTELLAIGEQRTYRVRKCRTCQNTKHWPRWKAAQESLLWGGLRFGEDA